MKKFLLIIMLVPAFCLAQNKNDNIVIAHGITFRQVVTTFLDAGYILDKIDSNYYTLKTEYKKVCNDCLPQLMFNVRVKDSSAIITGKWRSSLNLFSTALSDKDSYTYFDIANEKMKVPKICFFEMDRIARSLTQNVTYAKQ